MTAVPAPLGPAAPPAPPAPEVSRRRGAFAAGARVAAWWLAPVPLVRLAVLRRAVYAFVVFDVFVLVNDVIPHAYGPAVLYRPILLPRLLGLPAPTPAYAHTLRALLIGAAVVAALGRLPRVAGWVVAVTYLNWILIGYSYGKVDHDHLALVVALFVLPLAGATRGVAPGVRSEAAGWALRCVQVAAICTYFLSSYAKVRHGGWMWGSSATFAWALTRRGTELGDALLAYPRLLVVSQWGLLVMEALTPVVLFLRGRALAVALGGLLAFHVVTYLAIEIHFLPTVVCLLAFVPVERLHPRRLARS